MTSSHKSSQHLLLPWEKFAQTDRPRIAVLGDLILDEYWEGAVNRISPEAPVPVHLVQRQLFSAGGAASVTRNVKLAGGEVDCYCLTGDDQAARDVCRLLEADGISTSNFIRSTHRQTIRKVRVTAQRQQLVRIDWERIDPATTSEQDQLFEKISSSSASVFLLSDYGKGTLNHDYIQRLIALGNLQNKRVVIDPKGLGYEKYQGAHLITPNRDEAIKALGLDPMGEYEPLYLAQKLKERFGLRNVLVTLGAKGMFGFGEDDPSWRKGYYLPAKAQDVYDVSGAGDTVVALFALAIAAGSSLRDAMIVSNLGAGLVVQKWGTQPVQAEELRKAWSSFHLESAINEASRSGTALSVKTASTTKIVSVEQLMKAIGHKQSRSIDQVQTKPPDSALAQRVTRVVMTNGCFDLLHAGHVTYLEGAKALGDTLVVAINSDDSVKRLKGSTRPIVPLAARMQLIAALGAVDYVIAFDQDTPRELIAQILPDVLVKGADYTPEQIVGAKEVLAAGGSVETLPLVQGLSSTDLVTRILATKK